MTVRIDADLLIPGRGDTVADATVVLDGPVITYAGPRDSAPETPDAEVVAVPTVMPGMWECHGHLFGGRSADLSMLYREPVALRAARAAVDLQVVLRAGFTSVREAGGLGIHLTRAIAEGTLLGPTVYSPGAILSTTGGHGDLHDLPLDWVHAMAGWEPTLRLCDGVDECVRAVREQLRMGAKVIKVCASGGVMSEIDHPIHQQFTDQELRAIVEVAGMAEVSVMAHCHGRPGIEAALEAGVRTIEHGTFLDDDLCAAMVEKDVLLVTTRYIVTQLRKVGATSGMSPASFAKLTALADLHAEAMARAHAAGVRIALGTDVFGSGTDLPVAWGHNARELLLLQEIGMSPAQAIEAATANGPDTLGLQAPRSGQLRDGYDADVLAVAGNPLQDLSLLVDGGAITHVWKAGELVHTAPAPAPVVQLPQASARDV